MEDIILEEDSEDEIDDWKNHIADPGNIRGRLSQFKQTLHL